MNFLARKENYSQLHWTFMILHVGINNSSCSRVHGQDDIMHVSIIVIKPACDFFKAEKINIMSSYNLIITN